MSAVGQSLSKLRQNVSGWPIAVQVTSYNLPQDGQRKEICGNFYFLNNKMFVNSEKESLAKLIKEYWEHFGNEDNLHL